MEESFDVFQELIARRLIAGVGTKQRQGTVSKETQNPKIEKTRAEQRLVMPEKQDLTAPDFVRIEKNIAAFGFFTPSSKRIKNVPKVLRFSQTIEGRKVEAEVIISGSMQYGMPITADQDKYLAFQKIIDRVKQAKGRVENPIKFTTAELLALLGSSKNGNRYKEVSDWLKVMKGTTIESNGAVWVAGKKRFATDVFSIFDRIRSLGDELDDGTIADQNYVWLSDWYLENLNNFYLLPIDFEAYKQLKNHIAKALIPLLQIWLYASREQGVFEKRYDEICQILNIAQYSYPSKIKEKLAPSFNELIKQDYLSDWEVAETADKKDYKIIFWHGRKFYQDQTKRLSKANKARRASRSEKNGGRKLNRKHQLPPASREIFNRLQNEFDVAESKALELVRNFSIEKIKVQIESFSYRREKVENISGFIIRAIENDYSLPEGYLELLKKKERLKAEEARTVAIAACSFCDDFGSRNVKSEQDTFYGVMHECTHDSEVEKQFEDHTF